MTERGAYIPMRLRIFAHLCKEGFKNVISNKLMSLASMSTVFISLLLLAAFLLVGLNVQYLLVLVEDQVELVAYLEPDFDRGKWKELLLTKMRRVTGVEAVQYVTKEEALEELKTQFGEQANLLAPVEGDHNPLRDSVEVALTGPEKAEEVAAGLTQIQSVQEVSYPSELIDKLVQIRGFVRSLGAASFGLLAVATILLISNTVRVSVFARRDEIGVLKLVGATDRFVTWPFFIEGLIIGAVGTGLAIGCCWYGYEKAVAYLSQTLPFLPFLPPQPMLSNVSKLLAAVGLVLSSLGSFLSTRRYLRV